MESAVPLQCMADGEVVAWRLNKDYQKSTFLGHSIQYTTTFVLVKSVCQPDPNNEQTWLEFYSLYMGLAPLSAFEKRKCMVAKTKVRKRRAGNDEGSQSAGNPAYAPQVTGRLEQGKRILILKEATLLNKPVSPQAGSGATEAQPFGLAQEFDENGKLKDEKFWVTLLPEHMEENGEHYAHLPVWMQQAVAKGTCDAVGKPDAPLKINAGDAIGFPGEDIAPAGKAQISDSAFAHIEVLCVDSRMPAFLDNPGGVKAGRKYIRVHPDAVLYTNSGDTFTKTTSTVSKDMHIILPVDKCNPKTVSEKTYYQAGQNYWLCQDNVDVKGQYYLKELGFTALVEESTPDMAASLKEGWMKSAYQWLAGQVRPERGIQEQQMSRFYKGMMDKMDTDKDGQLSERELFSALHHPEMGVRDIVSRMVVKHESEWFGGSGHQKWTAFFQDCDTLRIDIAKKWLDDMEWMSRVEPFTSGKAVWHMHPVMFLDYLKGSQCACDRDITLEEFQKFVVGVNAKTISSYLNEMNAGFKKFGINKCREKAHFLAQVLHESGNFRFTKEINGERASYQPWFGRGLIQITLRDNYVKYGEYISEDVTSSDAARNKLTNLPHSVLSAFWYYDVSRKLGEFAKNDDFNKITAVINGGFNGYNDRLSIFNSAVKSLGAEHLNKKCESKRFSFEASSVYQSKVYALAWGLWHDPASNRNGVDKDSEEALKGYQRAKELISSSPFPVNRPHVKIYGIEYAHVLDYVNQRIEGLQ
ncbi:hypothetical protein AAIO65_02350 [Erwinia amylovora]